MAQANAGKAAALNAGIARASGEVLIFVDADGVFTAAAIPELLPASTIRAWAPSAATTSR